MNGKNGRNGNELMQSEAVGEEQIDNRRKRR